MTRESIIQLMQSSNADDVEIALHFLFSYRIKEIREIIPGGKWEENQQAYLVSIKPTYYGKDFFIKYHNCLYLRRYPSRLLLFHTRPFKWTKYTSLYGTT